MNSRPILPVSGGRKLINLLGAVTDDGDRFVTQVPGRLKNVVARYFLRALQQEFGDRLAIVLDNAPYFFAKALKKQAAASLLLGYLPPYSPEMNPLEAFWRQLEAARTNRLFLSPEEVKQFSKQRCYS